MLFTTVVTTLSIALGLSAMCIAYSILGGYNHLILDVASRFTSDVMVRSQLSVVMSDPSALEKRLSERSDVESVDELLEREALCKLNGNLDGVMLNGITKAREELFRPLLASPISDSSFRGIVVGVGLAKSLNVSVHDTLTLIVQKENGAGPAVVKLVVSGIFQSGMASQDDNIGLVPINILRQALGTSPAAASALLVRLNPNADLSASVQSIQSDNASSIFCATYREVFQGIWGWIELQRKPIPIILALIAIVAVVSIVSALFLMIVQKTQSIAILATLGLPSSHIGAIVIARALITSIVGVSIGLALTAGFAYVQTTYQLIRLDSNLYYVSVLPVHFDLTVAMPVAGGILALSCLVSIIPMLVARNIRPAAALRFS